MRRIAYGLTGIIIGFLAVTSCMPARAANQLPVVNGTGGPVQADPTFALPALVPLTGASGNVANAAAVATLAKAASTTGVLTGFKCTAAGATAASVVSLTVVGLAGGTLTYTFTFPAGATVAANAIEDKFVPPLLASGQNVDIVVTLPAGGAGNTNASCVAQGFRL